MTAHHRAAGLADFAALLADKSRAAMCLALLDGRAWTAGELAEHAGIAPSTATEHLNRLITAGLLMERRQGRHRYVSLNGADVAELLESMGARLADGRPAPSGLRAASAGRALARGRTCYDHLAGRLGIILTDAMVDRDLIDLAGGFSLSPAGHAWFTEELSVDTGEWARAGRPVVRECLDWTERRSHVAGIAGAELCRTFLKRGWVRRIGSGRAVKLTDAGVRVLGDFFDIDARERDLV